MGKHCFYHYFRYQILWQYTRSICWNLSNSLVFTNGDALAKVLFYFEMLVEDFLKIRGVKNIWVTPPMGWLKINTYAVVKKGKASITFVVWNEEGSIILLVAKIIAALVHGKEVVAILWASEVPAQRNWPFIEWSITHCFHFTCDDLLEGMAL